METVNDYEVQIFKLSIRREKRIRANTIGFQPKNGNSHGMTEFALYSLFLVDN